MARFVELGGRVMDSAYIYGTSEAVIGDLASELGIHDQLFLATKTDIRGQLQGVDGLRSAFGRLKTEVIDVMLVHNLVNVATELPILREWKDAGRIRYIGASISTLDQFDEMEQFIRTEDVDVVQFNYSLGDRAADERLLPAAADRGHALSAARQRQLRGRVRAPARAGYAAASGGVLRQSGLRPFAAMRPSLRRYT